MLFPRFRCLLAAFGLDRFVSGGVEINEISVFLSSVGPAMPGSCLKPRHSSLVSLASTAVYSPPTTERESLPLPRRPDRTSPIG